MVNGCAFLAKVAVLWLLFSSGDVSFVRCIMIFDGLNNTSSMKEEPCMTGGLVPGTRKIKGSVLGRLPYYLVW